MFHRAGYWGEVTTGLRLKGTMKKGGNEVTTGLKGTMGANGTGTEAGLNDDLQTEI